MRVRLSEFLLDTDTRELRRADASVHLSPKAFDLLVLLVRERPRVISKAEFFGTLWPSTFVADATLASVIAEVRSALGDKTRNPRFIRTVHAVGYAFCGAAIDDRPSSRASSTSRCVLVWDAGQIRLVEGKNILGRTATPALALSGTTLSRRHACLTVSGGRAVLEDLGSKNGTFVRGVRVTERVSIADGDDVRLGSIRLTFQVVADDEATASLNATASQG